MNLSQSYSKSRNPEILVVPVNVKTSGNNISTQHIAAYASQMEVNLASLATSEIYSNGDQDAFGRYYSL